MCTPQPRNPTGESAPSGHTPACTVGGVVLDSRSPLPTRYPQVAVIPECEAVTLEDIARPTTSHASYLLNKRKSAGSLLVCDSAKERWDKYLEASQAAQVAQSQGEFVVQTMRRTEGGRQLMRRRTAPLLSYYRGTTTGRGVHDVQCSRCNNASRLYYQPEKSGEFHRTSNSLWLCRPCHRISTQPRTVEPCPVTVLRWHRWKLHFGLTAAADPTAIVHLLTTTSRTSSLPCESRAYRRTPLPCRLVSVPRAGLTPP